MKTVILCGGRGTRAHPHTAEIPKPLLEVADRPVLRHVMDIFAGQGLHDFVLAAGYRADLIRQFAGGLPAEWSVDVVDTGVDANTGERVLHVREQAGSPFLLTYGDGLADVDLGRLIAFHRSHAGAATVTTVPLPSPYGTIVCGGDGRVSEFHEKPRLAEHWINGGFMVVDEAAFGYWAGDDLERQVLPALAAHGELYAYAHPGFWKSLDTYKDSLELTALCAPTPDNPGGRPPWLRPIQSTSATPAS